MLIEFFMLAAVQADAPARVSQTPQLVVASAVRQARGRRGAGNPMNDYMQDYMLVAQGVDFSSSDDAAIDQQAEAYRAAVARLASDRYDVVPAQMRQSQSMQAKIHFTQQAANVDGEIDWATLRVSRNGGSVERMPVIAYNRMLAMALEMEAATALFPEEAAFAAARQKTDAWMAKFGSRDNAGEVFEAAAIEEARNVQMPAATKNDPNLVAMFRTAWGSSGIDYEIMKIHPRGGWGEKRDSLGRLIGRTHDAAIAARNPRNPEHCNLYTFTLLKLESGGVRRSSHSTKRIACENVR